MSVDAAKVSEEVVWERESGVGTGRKTPTRELDDHKTFKLDNEATNTHTQE